MKCNYLELKEVVSQMNRLNDEISLINWNREDGPKFSSVEEMKEFILNIENNNFDFLFDEDNETVTFDPNKQFIENFNYEKDNMYFFIYTFKRDNKYITYLSIKSLNDNDVINNLCGKENKDKDLAHSWFIELKNTIINNSVDDIITDLIIGAKNTIKKLETELQELASVN